MLVNSIKSHSSPADAKAYLKSIPLQISSNNLPKVTELHLDDQRDFVFKHRSDIYSQQEEQKGMTNYLQSEEEFTLKILLFNRQTQRNQAFEKIIGFWLDDKQ